MNSLAIVEEFDIVEQVGVDFAKVTISSSIDPFLLQLREEALDTGVVVGTSAARHTSKHLVGSQCILIAHTGILTAAVAVKDGSFGIRIPSDGFSQGSFHEFGIDFLARRIANDLAVVEIHDNRQIDPADLGLDIGNVSRPYDFGTVWAELLLHEILLIGILFLMMAEGSVFLLRD